MAVIDRRETVPRDDERWYESFFSGIVLDMWRMAASPEQTRAETDFIVRSLGLRPGARVLDVPCGQGRHALELASRGFAVTGTDLSREAIEEARARAAAEGLDITFRHADMRDLPRDVLFDGAYCLGNSFGYLVDAGTRAFVGAVSKALRPGGRFVLDYGMAAECILAHWREREWARIGDILFLEENSYEPLESRVRTVYTFVRGDETRTCVGLQRVHTVREVRGILEDAGFATREILGSTDGAAFTVGSACLVVVAEKKEGDLKPAPAAGV